jgi:competence protein ComEC
VIPFIAAGYLWLMLWVVQFGWQAVTVVLLSLVLVLVSLKKHGLLGTLEVAVAGALIFIGFGLSFWQGQSGSSSASTSVAAAAKNFEVRHLRLEVVGVNGSMISVTARLGDSTFAARTFSNEKISVGDAVEGDFRLTTRDSATTIVLKPQDDLAINRRPISFIEEVRGRFIESACGVSADARALVLGLSIGEDSALGAITKERMQILSLTHLTAVSGANCAIVLAGVYFMTARMRLPRVAKLGLCLLALSAYVQLVGPEPSVLRAALMTAVIAVGLMAGRRVPPLIGLAAATFLSLVIWPSLALSLGFSLSVASTAAILILAPRLYERFRSKLGKPIALALAVSVSAQLWCLPLLLDLQDGIPTYSVLANLLAEPLVAPITILGLLAVITAMLFPALTHLLTWIASLFAELVVKLSRLAELPVNTIWWPTGLFGLSLITLLAGLITFWLIKARRWPLLASASVLLIWAFGGVSQAVEYSHWPNKNWQVISCDVGQGDATVVKVGSAIAVVDVGRDPEPVDTCLRRLGIRHIALLVLTHFDADHVGGLSGALKGRTIEQALISPFEDERPLATISVDLLRRAGITATSAACCQAGSLGASPWQVIQPEPRAAGSEDSNDASLIIRFDLPQLILFTLADQGERGQSRAVRNHFELLQNPEQKPVVIKVSHHGSADQYPELYEYLKPTVALVSVGVRNPYGHPTERTLKLLKRVGARVFRTDLVGGVAVEATDGGLTIAVERGG